MTVRSAAEIIADIRKLDAGGAPPDAFRPLLREAMGIWPIAQASRHRPGVQLCRATSHHTVIPRRTSDLSHPPPELTRDNRANRAGAPMFYCATDKEVALRELKASTDQVFVVSTWTTTGVMMLTQVGYADVVFNRSGVTAAPGRIQHECRPQTSEQRALADFLALAFTEPSPRHYNLTIAIAEHMLPVAGAEFDRFSGLLYPLAQRNEADCVALIPEFVEKYVSLTAAAAFVVTGADKEGISYKPLAELEGTGTDGALTWRHPESRQLPPGASEEMGYLDGIRLLSGGTVSVDGREYTLEPGHLIRHEPIGVVVRDLRGELVQLDAREQLAVPVRIEEPRGFRGVRIRDIRG